MGNRDGQLRHSRLLALDPDCSHIYQRLGQQLYFSLRFLRHRRRSESGQHLPDGTCSILVMALFDIDFGPEKLWLGLGDRSLCIRSADSPGPTGKPFGYSEVNETAERTAALR